MATGYTCHLVDGKEISFKEFALICARAFGACIDLRDEPMSTPIPEEFKPSSYHADALIEAQQKLEEYNAMTDEEISSVLEVDYQDELNHYLKSIAEQAEKRRRYEVMLSKAKAWVPPSPDHKGIKDFMVKQITDSIDWDCKHEHSVPKKKTIEEWRNIELDSIKWNIKYHTEGCEKEVQRAKNHTRWVKQLRESIAQVEN